MWRGNKSKISFIFSLFFFLFLIPQTSFSQTQILWSEDWERQNWNDDWSVEGGTWEVGTPISGPNSAYNGNRCAATVLAGDYSENVDIKLIKDVPFTVPKANENPRIRFWSWYSISTSDWASVQIKTSNGTWEELSPKYEKSSSNLYYHVYIDLKAYADSSVQIAFHFESHKTGTFSDTHVSTGWYLDDITVETGPLAISDPEDWESGIDDWYVDFGTWQVGIPSSGPDSAHTGLNCAGTILDGNYIENVDSRLISPPFTLPSSTENPRLRFWNWYNISSSDGAIVQIKVNSGEWQDLSPTYTKSSSNLYYHTNIDLSAFADSTVQIAFYFYSRKTGTFSDTHVSSGWYVDDIGIETGPVYFNNPQDWESGIDDWYVTFGTWQVGNPTSGPNSAYSENNCLGTILQGNYIENVRSQIISPAIQIPSADKNPKLTFWHWYNISSSDFGYVQIKVEGGEWENIMGPFEGTSGGVWTPPSYQLSSFADSVVQFAFYFESNKTGTFSDTHVSSGWYIDDIKITGVNSSPEVTIFSATPTSGEAPLDVSFTAAASDADGSIVDYYWDFNGDGINDDTTATGSNSYIYTENGSYNATCRVSDDQGALSAPANVPINVYSATTRVVSLPDDSATVGATFVIPVRINDVAGIAGAAFRLNFNSSVLEVVDVSSTDLTSGFSVADTINDGSLAISMARATGLGSGSGDFVNITFHVLPATQVGQTSALTLDQVSLYDADTNPIAFTSINGLFTVKSGSTVEGNITRIMISPHIDTLGLDQTALFSAYGIDAEENQVEITVDWVYQDVFLNPGNIGSATGQTTLFTAGAVGDGYIAASYVFETDTLLDTSYVIVGETKGDINVDETVNVPDAILCLQVTAEIMAPSLYQTWAADYNNDQNINAGDALGILNAALSNLFPKMVSHNTFFSKQTGAALIYTISEFNESNRVLSVPVFVENRRDICGLDLTFGYNTLDYELINASASKTTSLMVQNPENFKVSTINQHGLSNDAGEILCLFFKAKDKNSTHLDLNFSSLQLFDYSGIEISNSIELNRIEQISVPQKYVLYQNYPNPFNPSTTIKYELSAAGTIKMNIYNVNGQLVRTLFNGRVNPGTYTVNWDGLDNKGLPVSSGAYFLQD